MKKYILITGVICSLTNPFAWAESNHAGKKSTAAEQDHHDDKEDHESEESHGHGAEEKEESTSVGPEKGILEASEAQGVKLSPEALRNFELKTQKLAGNGPWTFPISARFQSGEEVNLYRLRNGFFKRIDFVQNSRTSQQLVATSKELRAGDEVVIAGLGYLRIAEVTAFGGNSEGHSH